MIGFLSEQTLLSVEQRLTLSAANGDLGFNAQAHQVTDRLVQISSVAKKTRNVQVHCSTSDHGTVSVVWVARPSRIYQKNIRK